MRIRSGVVYILLLASLPTFMADSARCDPVAAATTAPATRPTTGPATAPVSEIVRYE